MKPVILAVQGKIEDRGEPTALMGPLLIAEGSRHPAELADLVVELVGQSAGFRRSLPDGVLTGLATLVRATNCYYSNLIEGAQHPPGRYRTRARGRLQHRARTARSPA